MYTYGVKYDKGKGVKSRTIVYKGNVLKSPPYIFNISLMIAFMPLLPILVKVAWNYIINRSQSQRYPNIKAHTVKTYSAPTMPRQGCHSCNEKRK